MNKNLVAT